MRVLIAGAGIGGLSTALSLHAAGIDAVVVDAVRVLRPLGVGINILPHAVRELTELGLGDELAASGIATDEMVHFDRFGNRIWGMPRGMRVGYRWPQYSIHRGELQMLLLDAVRTRLGHDAVRPGHEVESFDEVESAVRVRLSDRASGQPVEMTADALVGADGLHSTVRAQLHPGEGPPRWNGIRMWRGVAETDTFLNGHTVAVAGSNRAAKFVAYPISGHLVNWVAELRLPHDTLTESANWTRRGRLQDVLPHFAEWSFDWLDVPALIKGSPEILEYPMVDRDPLPSWGRGRVTLLGDAAHPMYPIGSNGGSQAIIDARVLAYELARAGDAVTGVAAYEAARREVTNGFVLANRDMPADRVLQTVAERAPGGFARIEDVLSADELAAIDAAYVKTSGTDVELLNSRPSWSVSTKSG